VRPDPSAVSWVNPRLDPGEERRGGHRHSGQDRRGLHRGPGDGRVPLSYPDHRPERHQRHQRGDRRGVRERGAGVHRTGPDRAGLPARQRRQGLGVRIRIRQNPNIFRIHWVIPWSERVGNAQKRAFSVRIGWQSGWQSDSDLRLAPLAMACQPDSNPGRGRCTPGRARGTVAVSLTDFPDSRLGHEYHVLHGFQPASLMHSRRQITQECSEHRTGTEP